MVLKLTTAVLFRFPRLSKAVPDSTLISPLPSYDIEICGRGMNQIKDGFSRRETNRKVKYSRSEVNFNTVCDLN